jgi:hypothetical protein
MQIERVENMKNGDRLSHRCRILLSFVARNGKTILPRDAKDARAALKIDCWVTAALQSDQHDQRSLSTLLQCLVLLKMFLSCQLIHLRLKDDVS